ncbi:pectate lyase [Roseateles sp. MS654]|uniref:pectate lyase n=1 Tax=Roseateles sp. MS654 TaxID=3412685 RepID=UPI003C2D3C8F
MSAIDPIPSLNGSGSGPRMSMMQLYQQQLYAEPQPAPPQANAIAPLMMMLAQQIMAMLVQQLMQSLQAMQGQQGMPPGSPGGGGGGGLGGGGAFAPTGGPAGGSAAAPNGSGGPGGSGNTSPLPGPSSTPPAQAPAKPHAPTSPTSSSPATSVLPPHSGEVAVNKPIVVGAGETFDGRNQLFTAGSGLSGNSAETYQPVFILGPGATLKNVQFQGGDGIHLLGDAKIDNVHAVHGGPDDMITIDGPGNRARDAQLAGISPGSIPSRPAEVEITNSSFRHSHDKAIQVNGDANVKLRGVHADDVGQLLVTLGGQPIKAHVSIEDSHFSGVRSHLVRLDDRASTLDIGRNVSTDTGRIQVMMGSPGNASGATVVMPSTDAVGN